jgi:hypothetical protein
MRLMIAFLSGTARCRTMELIEVSLQPDTSQGASSLKDTVPQRHKMHMHSQRKGMETYTSERV